MELKDRTANETISNEMKFKQKTGEEFSSFYQKYLPKLIYFTTKLCKDEQLAQDITIDSFMDSLEKIDKYDPEKSRFSTWLFTIARNKAFQELKKGKKFISMDATIDEEGTTIGDFVADNSEEDREREEKYELDVKKSNIIKENIIKLKQPYRTVIEMRELKKMSYKDIASELGNDSEIELTVNSSDLDYKFRSDGSKVLAFTLPNEISKAYEVVDNNGNKVNYNLIEGDTKKTPFYTHIEIPEGNYRLRVREPKNLSTLKSQIRNGRLKLQKMVEKDFNVLDKMYM